jgi:hypothetical protein
MSSTFELASHGLLLFIQGHMYAYTMLYTFDSLYKHYTLHANITFELAGHGLLLCLRRLGLFCARAQRLFALNL